MTRRDGCLAVAKAFALSLRLKIIIGLVQEALYGLTLGNVKLLDLDRLKRERMWTSSYFPAILRACTHVLETRIELQAPAAGAMPQVLDVAVGIAVRGVLLIVVYADA